MAKTLFVTGTDTGVGKTVLSVLLIRALIGKGFDAEAVKPLCSGGREDALELWAAQEHGRRNQIGGQVLEIADINPWWFEEPLTPLVAARRSKQPVRREEVVGFLRSARSGGDILLVEGAGGLLSPLGEDLDARDLIRLLDGTPLVVAANRLGVLNHVLLTYEALPTKQRARAQLVLMEPARNDLVSRTNFDVLIERLGPDRVHRFPRLPQRFVTRLSSAKIPERVNEALDRLIAALLG